jgi:hypothetical protein
VKVPLPGAPAAAVHAVPAPHAALDDAAMQPTPPPVAAPGVGHSGRGAAHGPKTNGVTAHASSPAVPFPGGESDALSALNMGTPARAVPPRIMEVGEATAWAGAGRVQEGRHRNTKLVFGVLGVFCIMIVVLALNMRTKAPAVVTAAKVKGGLDSESLDKLHDIIIEGGKPTAPLAGVGAPEEPPAAPEPPRGGKSPRGHGPTRGRPQPSHGGAAVAAPPAPVDTPPAPPPPAFRERHVTPVVAAPSRPPPSQADITRVIANNKLGIKTCYQRALLRDSSLTHGKIVVGVTIGLSGRVKGVRVDGPTSFRVIEPCIKEMVGRWTFPQASEEYGTEFSYLFQGNE